MQFFSVEYSSLSSNALLQLMKAKYKIGDNSSIRFLKRGFNDTYYIEEIFENEDNQVTSATKYILRVYKHKGRSLESIETELKLLNFLNENNVSVSFPIKDNNGSFIQHIQAPEGIRYAVLFSFAEGEQVRKLSSDQSYLLGLETGKIHLLTKDQSFGITAQNYDIHSQFENTLISLKPILRDYPEQYNYLLQLKDDFVQVFKNIDKTQLTSGICHGDLQAENIHLTAENKVTFFDFDFFGKGYLVYDIGVFMWYDHKNKPPEIIKAFLKGYQTQKILTATEIKLIPYFSTLRALFQMTLYCKISDGKQLPIWPATQVAAFIDKVKKWQTEKKNLMF